MDELRICIMIGKFLNTVPGAPAHQTTVVDWLDCGMKQSSDAVALCYGKEKLSNRELDARSNRVAQFLIKIGVEPGDRIGICMDRSIDLIVVLLGILKSGAAYVPLDPAYPADRLGMMVEDAGLRLVLVHQAHESLFSRHSVELMVCEEAEAEMATVSDDPVGVAIDSESVAYVIFTSGSTGRPKGIAMPHRALSNLIEWQMERKTFKPQARVLQYSSISFDVSFQEIATTLASGGTLHLISDEDRKDPRRLLRQLADSRIERIFLPYVAMRSMIEAAHVMDLYPEPLKEVITAGEQLRVDDAVRTFFSRLTDASLDNQYGPSETHVITANLLEGNPAAWQDLPSIGTPIKNCGAYILDEAMQPVNDGEAGELYLSGRNLAQGYINNDEITSKSFLASPFDIPAHTVLYKTGDLATRNPDGSINFLGRRDHQIKIRGHRVEPGEVNNAAVEFADIGHCLTHAMPGADGAPQLVAYYTVKEGTPVETSDLRHHLAERLPDYMVPSFLIEIEEIPYTPSGKVDLKSLPKPSIENSRYAGETLIFESDTERKLAELWSELLDMAAIPRTADFFDLGGNSLRAVTLFLRIEQQFGKILPLSTLTHASRLFELAAVIDGHQDYSGDLSAYRSLKMLQQGINGVPPLFLVHGGQGNVLVFNKLVHMLDRRQPIYAFQWPGWDGRPGPANIRRMARAYCEELMRFHPEGPVHLGGYCIGGLIAIEMVRELEAAERAIFYPLVVWDSPNLKSRHYRRDEPWDNARTMNTVNRLMDGLDEIRIDTGEQYKLPRLDYTPPSGKAAWVRSIPGVIRFLRFGNRMKQNLSTIPLRSRICWIHLRGGSIPMEWRAENCIRSMIKAVHRHRSSQFVGDMLYFRSDCVVARYFGLPGWWDDPFLGYAELCDGNFEAHAIGGSHTDVLDIPEMGAIVKQVLESTE